MKITLETVRHVLRDALGFHSFTASLITQVIEDATRPTACITREGHLRYNPAFVEEHITTDEDLFSLIFHELLHPMFGHFVHGQGEIENIACDATINAIITNLYPEESREGSLFRKIYSPRGLDGILRPGSRMTNSRYSLLYDRLYLSGHWHAVRQMDESLSTGEIIQTLKILTDTVKVSGILLIGSHGKGESQEVSGLPQDVLARIAEDIKASAQRRAAGQGSGFSLNLLSLLMEALRTHLSIRKVLLQRFTTKRKVDRFKALLQQRRSIASPIPIRPSKRDLVLLASGLYPLHFRNEVTQTHYQNRGLAVYLDVSGSVNDHLPKILGILRGLRREITTVFQFSNRVIETPFAALLRGRIQTTYGTDFNCIAHSILERGFDKAVILTDGISSMSSEHRDKLKECRFRALTILFGGTTECPDFSPFGDVLQLEDVCQGGSS